MGFVRAAWSVTGQLDDEATPSSYGAGQGVPQSKSGRMFAHRGNSYFSRTVSLLHASVARIVLRYLSSAAVLAKLCQY